MSDPITPPCYGQHVLFDSVNLLDHLVAKEICDTCPIIDACAKEMESAIADSTSGGRPEGTWAGQLLDPERPRSSERRSTSVIRMHEERYSEEEARTAFAQYRAGWRGPWIEIGARVFKMREKRASRARKDVA